MGRDDFRKGGFSKSSGSALDAFEAAMRGSNHTDADLVRNAAEDLFAGLTEEKDSISGRSSFSVTIEVKEFDESMLGLFEGAVSAVLRKYDLLGVASLGHDGGDGFYNPRDGDTMNSSLQAAKTYNGSTISRITLFFRYDLPCCPCCESSDDVYWEGFFGGMYYCRDSNCDNFYFRVNWQNEPYHGGEYPKCQTCNDRADVDSTFGHCGSCDEEYEEYGCAQFYCNDCGHHIDRDGDCVDPNCDCEDWDDDDDDDDDDY